MRINHTANIPSHLPYCGKCSPNSTFCPPKCVENKGQCPKCKKKYECRYFEPGTFESELGYCIRRNGKTL